MLTKIRQALCSHNNTYEQWDSVPISRGGLSITMMTQRGCKDCGQVKTYERREA